MNASIKEPEFTRDELKTFITTMARTFKVTLGEPDVERIVDELSTRADEHLGAIPVVAIANAITRLVDDKTRACPPWCVSHSEFDEGTPDHSVIHRGEENEAGGYTVRLGRCDWVTDGAPGEVAVLLDDTDLCPQQATALAGLLASAAATASSDRRTWLPLDLPEGQDYLVFKDINVVAVSSRLDEAGRRRALAEAGVR